MRYLYDKESTTYDVLLAAIKDAETEWLEVRGQLHLKSAVVTEKSEIEELRQKLDKLQATVKAVTTKKEKEKKKTPKTSPRKEDPRKQVKGPSTSAAGPFKPDQKPMQCYKCEGWGHGWRECATKGSWGTRPQGSRNPRHQNTVERDQHALWDLYHNPDPLVCLIGEPNETSVIVENVKVKGLVDSGAQISSILDTLAKHLELKIQKLETLLDLEPTGGGSVPYKGYVELRMQIPGVEAFNLDVLMLVIPESEYAKRVHITIGTLHIDEIISLITEEELQNTNKFWQRGIISRKIAVKSMQLKENKTVLDQVKGDVKLTWKIVIPPMDTVHVSGITKINSHSKRLNVITEPREEIDEYTLPSYTTMRPGSKKAGVALMNLSNQPITLNKGSVVATIKAANVVPPMLAPKPTSIESKVEEIPKKTPAWLEKLFSKLDLSGMDGWSQKQRDSMRKVFEDYHHLFALEDLELDKTDLVKHVIKLNNPKPFRERYHRIPPHQYEEVKKYLKEMVEIGAIQKSQSPWASAVVLVHKKTGELCFCIDLRKLNVRTVKDAQTLPRIEDSLDSLNGAIIFTSLDLKNGYWQVKLDEDSIPYTAFMVGPLGFYECLRMPFGLTNTPAMFQRLMENCLGDLHLNWCIIYLHNIIVYSKTPEEHIKCL